MRVLHIIDSGGIYGAEIMLLNLAAEQIKLGIDPVICSIGAKRIKEKPLETLAIKNGIRVYKSRMTPGPNYSGSIRILRAARKEGFDVLHSHGYKGNILFGFIPKAARRIPLISTFHGRTNTKRMSKLRLYEYVNNLSLNCVDKVVLVNEALESQTGIRHKKLFTVNNGIPDLNDKGVSPIGNDPADKCEGLDSSIIEFCKRGYTIGSIGRLSEEKGFCYLVEAVHMLVEEGFEARLVIIGEGSERGRIESIISDYNIDSFVYIPGYRQDARKYLSCFKIFVIPSLTEGLPIALLEAMQVGIPTVATSVGGIPNVLRQGLGGILVKPGDAKSICQAIKKVIIDPSIGKDLAAAAHKIVVKDYSSSGMAKEYLSIYRKAVEDWKY